MNHSLSEWFSLYNQPPQTDSAAAETVEQAAKPLVRARLHDGRDSISGEKVVPSVMRGVISDVHAAGNDGFHLIPAAAAAGTPCRRAFSQTEPPQTNSAAAQFFIGVGKPPALPVEVPRKKALASSIERSELLTASYQG